MMKSNYNIEFLSKEVENARKSNYFSRIESFYKKLPKTECDRCGQCCFDPPVMMFVEFLYVYEMYSSFSIKTKEIVLKRALKKYLNSLVDKLGKACCFMDENNSCMIYERSCLSCKAWGNYGRNQYEMNWKADSQYNKEFQRFYKNKFNIDILDDELNKRIPYCDKVKITKNPYNIQEVDYSKYIKSLNNVEIKCYEHARIKPTDGWSVVDWLIYFYFGMEMFNVRIELTKKVQSGQVNAIEEYVENFNLQPYLIEG